MLNGAVRSAEAISTDEAARLFEPLAEAKGLVLAVSGGPDSMTLMLLAAQWAREAPRPHLVVATVDHGLRPSSAGEAVTVGRWAAALGLSHRILPWSCAKPSTRIHERARQARYSLLAACAAERGASHIVLGHHADDQAETVLFRLIRGSGIGGLSGMAASTAYDGLVLARPFLGVPKARLVATCAVAGQSFLDDPSNADERFARARLRRIMPLLAEEGFDADALLRLARRAGRAEEALRRLALDRWQKLEKSGTAESFTADLGPLRSEPDEVVLRVLRMLVADVKEEASPPRLDRLEDLAERLRGALVSGEAFKGTLARTILSLDAQGKVTISRETMRRPAVLRDVDGTESGLCDTDADHLDSPSLGKGWPQT